MMAMYHSLQDDDRLLSGDLFSVINGGGFGKDTASPTDITRLLTRIDCPNQESAMRLDGHVIDSYRVGLIPVENLFERSGSAVPILTKLDSVLVLRFSLRELLARLREELSETRSSSEATIVQFGLVTADFQRMEALRSGEPVALTPMQFKVLQYFTRNPCRVISRDELLNKVWGYNNYPTTRTVDNHVLRLRQALEPVPHEPVHFRTVHGAGYKFFP